ncbi:MAG: sulfite exporter TauE/SafE family protein [Maritimibacter sp.]|nr:sulfite exporter TauE/SafE family protein [Maritimibacter sp.]
MEGTMFWVLATLAAMFVGISKGGLPMAGAIAVPLLALEISPVAAAGLLLPVYVVSDMFGLWAYRHEFNKRVVAIVVAGAVVGIGLGWAVAALATQADEERWVTLLVGLIGLTFVINRLIHHRKPRDAEPPRVGRGLFWGAITGFTSFVSHSGAPPYQVYTLPLKMTRTLFAGTTTVTFAIINAVKLIPYFFLGQINTHSLEIAAVLAIPAAIAVFIGVWLVKVMSEKLYFTVILSALFVLSLKLIWDGIMG